MLEGSTADVSVSQVNNSMVFTPKTDFFGVIQNVWLNVSDGSTTHSAALTLTVEPVADLPFVNIESVQLLGGSTANMYWSVTDVDGAVSTDANVSVDNVNVAVNHSCLSSTNGVYQCVTLLPINGDPSTSVYIELEIYDAELGRSVVANIVFDPTSSNATNNGQNDAGQDDAGGLGSGLFVGAGLVLLVGLIAGVVMFLRSREDVAQAPHVPEPEPVETESGGGGLLARANRLK